LEYPNTSHCYEEYRIQACSYVIIDQPLLGNGSASRNERNSCTATKRNFHFGPFQDVIGRDVGTPCGGGLEYLHRSPACRKRRQKGNRVSNEAVRYSLKFCATWTRERQRFQGPVASYGMLRRVALVRADVSEELSASFLPSELTWYFFAVCVCC
jgi:hypothetical protein